MCVLWQGLLQAPLSVCQMQAYPSVSFQILILLSHPPETNLFVAVDETGATKLKGSITGAQDIALTPIWWQTPGSAPGS